MIIGLSGKKQSGKNTVASIIMYLFAVKNDHRIAEKMDAPTWLTTANSMEMLSGWQQKGFADKVKQVASLLTGIPVRDFEDGKFKETNLPEEWSKTTNSLGHKVPMKVRVLLQKIGTEAIRNQIHSNAWVNALFAEYTNSYPKGAVHTQLSNWTPKKWIITDVRFPNEFDAIKERNGLLIRVIRPTEEKEKDSHPSEIALDSYGDWDYIIINDGTIEDLVKKVETALKTLKIL